MHLISHHAERVVLPLAVKRGRGHELAERIAEKSEASRANLATPQAVLKAQGMGSTRTADGY